MTRVLMSASALLLGVFGLLATFVPDLLLNGLRAPASPAILLVVQVLGALYIGFAGLNWMTRDSLIGGIYSRPVVIGNLMHFLVAGLTLVKAVARAPDLSLLWPVALVYAGFAVAFGFVLFRHPVSKSLPAP